MAYVFIEEVGGPIRVCSKQATADRLGIESADVDLSGLQYSTEYYTLVSGALVELTDDVTAMLVDQEQAWVRTELAEADKQIFILEDGDPRGMAAVGDWRTYRKALRNRVTGGVIVGNRPAKPGS